MDNYENLYQFLVWLAGPAGTIACFIFVSNLVRNLRDAHKLENLSSWQVQTLVLVLSLLGPGMALGVVQLVPAETIAQYQDVWAILSVIAVSYLTQQGWYKATKNDGNNMAG